MTLIIFICLLLLHGILASKISINENTDLDKDLKSCLSTLIDALCPDCITLHLVIPAKQAWEADALAAHFSDSVPKYAIAMHTTDRIGYEDSPFDGVDLYLVNNDAELKMALEHLPHTKSGRNCVVLVNFYFGRNLGSYLQRTVSQTWKGGRTQLVVFAALIEGNVQVFGTPLQGSGIPDVMNFRQLGICNTNDLVEVPQPLSKVIDSQESDPKFILTVAVTPDARPFVENRTDNPGGIVGRYMKILETKMNLTTKYVWWVKEEDIPTFIQGERHRLVFNFFAHPKVISELLSPFFNTKSFWMIVTPEPLDRRNILAMPFRNNILFALMPLAIYIVVTVYLSRELDKTRTMLRLFGMFFGIGVGWLPGKGFYRFLVLLWCLISYDVLVQAYLASLMSELSTPISRKSFLDTDDLIESGVDIVCTKPIKEFYCNPDVISDRRMCEKCTNAEGHWALQQFFNGKLKSSEIWHPFAYPIESILIDSYPRSNSVIVTKEEIGSWPSMIYSNMNQEFLSKMTSIHVQLDEGGIVYHWLAEYMAQHSSVDEFEREILNMRNLNGTFIILYVGWSCSMVVFLIELLIKWYRNK